mgnify:CR=1 FL=1
MLNSGKIRSWNDDRGFGFIEPGEGGKDVFLHISALKNRGPRPAVGQTVNYTLTTDERGRPRAGEAVLPGVPAPRRQVPGKRFQGKKRARSARTVAFIASGAFIALVALAVYSRKIPPLVLWVYLGVSLLTFVVYAFDKLAAKDGAWRTPEKTLHWLSLVGGWPGALVAQQTLRHKSKKQSFRLGFWLTVVVNVSIFAWMFTPEGAETLQSWAGNLHSLVGTGQASTIEWAE